MIKRINRRQADEIIERFNTSTLRNSDEGHFLTLSKSKNKDILLTAIKVENNECCYNDFKTETIAEDWLNKKNYNIQQALGDDEDMFDLLQAFS